jgi:hypothetical protein
MKKYRRLLILFIFSAVIVWGLLRLGNVNLNAATLAQVDWRWLLLSIVVFYSGIFVRGLRWQRILRTMDWRLGYIYTQTLLVAGFFLSLVLPARLGDVGRVVMLKRDHQIPFAQGIASLAAERALDVFAILVLAIAGAVWALQGRVPPEILKLITGTAVLLGIGLIGLLAIPGLEKWLRHPGNLETWTPVRLWSIYQKVLDFGFNLINGVRALGRHPLSLAIAVMESLYIWLCDALIVYLGLLSVGVAASLSVSMFAAMIADLVTAVPITPAGLGQFEAALIWLLTQFNVTTAQASLTILLVRLVNLWLFLPIGAIVTFGFGFSSMLNLTGTETQQATDDTTLTPSPKLAKSLDKA